MLPCGQPRAVRRWGFASVRRATPRVSQRVGQIARCQIAQRRGGAPSGILEMRSPTRSDSERAGSQNGYLSCGGWHARVSTVKLALRRRVEGVRACANQLPGRACSSGRATCEQHCCPPHAHGDDDARKGAAAVALALGARASAHTRLSASRQSGVGSQQRQHQQRSRQRHGHHPAAEGAPRRPIASSRRRRGRRSVSRSICCSTLPLYASEEIRVHQQSPLLGTADSPNRKVLFSPPPPPIPRPHPTPHHPAPQCSPPRFASARMLSSAAAAAHSAARTGWPSPTLRSPEPPVRTPLALVAAQNAGWSHKCHLGGAGPAAGAALPQRRARAGVAQVPWGSRCSR